MSNKVHVFHKSGARSGSVSRIDRDDADALVSAEKAAFISGSLYRLAKLGGDISKMVEKRPDDATLKARINELRGKPKKKEKKSEGQA